MPPTTPKTDAIAAAETLTAGMAQFRDDIEALKSTDRRRKRILRVLGVSVAFDIVLSIGLGYVGISAQQAAHKASEATSTAALLRNNERAACLAGNEDKKRQSELWAYAFTFPPPVNESAEAKAQRLKTTADFKAYIDRTFVAKDCS